MPLKFTQRKAEDVPTPSASGKVNQDLVNLKNEMSKLAAGMVLEIETGSEKAVRGTKMLVTKAANQMGSRWKHWNVGSTVFARPMEAVRRRGRKPKSE
ncbi:MAG: hypothetical protein GEU75_09555 [Dehalococcoidia bacterium]|nr:hypothetical protein [Dehalococcoidia bacterium]